MAKMHTLWSSKGSTLLWGVQARVLETDLAADDLDQLVKMG